METYMGQKQHLDPRHPHQGLENGTKIHPQQLMNRETKENKNKSKNRPAVSGWN